MSEENFNGKTRERVEQTGRILRWATPIIMALLSVTYYLDRQIADERHRLVLGLVEENKSLLRSVEAGLKGINNKLAERGIMFNNVDREIRRQERLINEQNTRIRKLELGNREQ